jgi:acetyltransferase
VTNAGGPGIIATDAVERSGLRLAEFTRETVERLQAGLPPTASVFNPIDVIGDAAADRYEVALAAALADPNVDAVLVLFTPQAGSEPEKTAEVMARLSANQPKPVLASYMGAYSIGPALELLGRHRIPNYPFPERAVSALNAMYRQKRWSDRRLGDYAEFEVDRERVRDLFQRVREQGRVELGELEAREVMEAYGMRLPKSRLAQSPEEAAAIAAEIGFPVVMKISSPDILHKSDIGGVKVGVQDAAQARDTYELIEYRARKYSPTAQIWGVLVQEQVRKGREVLVGVSRDPQFGPLVAFGLGGIYVEVLKDVAFRIAPSRCAPSAPTRCSRAYVASPRPTSLWPRRWCCGSRSSSPTSRRSSRWISTRWCSTTRARAASWWTRVSSCKASRSPAGRPGGAPRGHPAPPEENRFLLGAQAPSPPASGGGGELRWQRFTSHQPRPSSARAPRASVCWIGPGATASTSPT